MPTTSQQRGTKRPLHAPGHDEAPQIIVTPEPAMSGWVGWIWFGVAIMAMVGIFNVIAGLVAILDDNFLVGAAGKLFVFDTTAWGWTTLAIGVLDERDARRAVGIVLDLADRSGDADLVALEVDDAVLPLVATATTPHRDVTVVVAAAALGERLDERLLGRGPRDLGEVRDTAEPARGRDRLELTNRH